MKTLQRDRKTVYYANPVEVGDIIDEYGNITGAPAITYETPRRYDRLSSARMSGAVRLTAYGLSNAYSTAFVTHDMNCPLTEASRLWVDVCPCGRDGKPVPHDYVVKRILPTNHAIRIDVERASAS